METIYLDNFLTDGIIKEKPFRQLVNEIKWSDYKDKRVLIKGCTVILIPFSKVAGL